MNKISLLSLFALLSFTACKHKVEEKKELLEHYEDKSYLYGRRAQDLQSHTHALIRNYEKAVWTNLQAAASHRQIATRLNETHAASDEQAPDI